MKADGDLGVVMPTPEDEMSLREIARTLTDFRAEFRSQIATLVRADVYRAEQAAMMQRIVTLERDNERINEDRAQIRRIILGTALSVVATVLGAVLIVGLTLN